MRPYEPGQCYSVVIGHTKDGDDIIEFNCLCFMSDSDALEYRHVSDSLAVSKARLARLIEYCQGKQGFHVSLGVPEMSLQERRLFLLRLPTYRPTVRINYLGVGVDVSVPKHEYLSINESTA